MAQVMQVEQSEDGTFLLHTEEIVFAAPTFADLIKKQYDMFFPKEEQEFGEGTIHGATTREMVEFLIARKVPQSRIVKILKKSPSTISQHIQDIRIHQLRLPGMDDVDQDISGFLREAIRFDTTKTPPEWLGKCGVYRHNGTSAITMLGKRNTLVFLSKNSIKHLKTLPGDELRRYIRNLPPDKRVVVLEYIETLKDEDLGILPKLPRNLTRIAEDGGSIDEIPEE